jgi:formylglycine-generating enzyme required for sulfatase activity
MLRIFLLMLFCFLSLILVACGGSEEATEEPPQINVEETVAAAVAETVAAQPPQEAEVVEVEEPTPYPTYTPLPTYTPFPTPEPVEVTPTEEATEEATVEATDEAEAGVGFATTPSPATQQPIQAAVREKDEATMVFVPGGTFLMGASAADLALTGAGGPAKLAGGDEQPQHEVDVAPFWIDRTEVTNAQYSNFVNLTGYKTIAEIETYGFSDGEQIAGATFYHPQGVESGIDDKLDHPVVQVSWDDAHAYCEWAGARLPTEAEWEKVAKGTANDRVFPWGNTFELPEFDVSTAANFCSDSCPQEGKDPNVDDSFARTAPVGSFPAGASPYGALDMAGNVWEWVDGFYEGYPGNTYELATEFGDYFRVVRGGSWDNAAQHLRSTFRQNNPPRARSDGTGFRCAVSADEFEPILAGEGQEVAPTTEPTGEPTTEPTSEPTGEPSETEPTGEPTTESTSEPTTEPTSQPESGG